MKLHYRLLVGLLTLSIIVLFIAAAMAYPVYQGAPSCDDCHPGFLGGFSGPAHQLHSNFATDCMLCHNAIGDNPPLSNCAGCHVQAGLVVHHTNAGAPPDGNGLFCATCHPGMVPAAEPTLPPYYSLASVLVKDPCVSTPAPPGEDFDGNGSGLDNDGDLQYDELDLDCIALPVEVTTWGRIKALYK
ncbi:MAG: hypothetical protein KAJ37_07135 [Candidatus Krumholzibacteria bacterium]|nr:hypothetical protein [Candidatus Krumholzibacteria bacterium]